jgi:uncharacterized membrane protein
MKTTVIEHSVEVEAPLRTACDRWRAARSGQSLAGEGCVSFEPIAGQRTRVRVKLEAEPVELDRVAADLRRFQRSFESD